MKRSLPIWAVVCLALAAGMLAWMKIGLLFPLPPSSSVVAGTTGLDGIFANAPPPRFRDLRYHEVLSDQTPDGVTWPAELTSTERVVERAGWRSVVQRQMIFRGPPKPGWYAVEPAGLFMAAETSAGGNVWLGQRQLSRVAALRDMEGTLFPLAPGNRLAFTAELEREGWVGPLRIRRHHTTRQEYRVVGTTDRWPAIPAPVFVITRTITGGKVNGAWNADGRSELHYAPALGAVVYERNERQTLGGSRVTRERQLVEWH